jgi:ABC-type nitrate/sulfonate/bicarbonate transport system ATPase subunit
VQVFCNGLEVVFNSGNSPTTALSNIDLATRQGEFLTIVGRSGCGKTTLLRTIAELIPPTRGTIERRSQGDDANQDALLVFQEHGLFPWMTVLDNAAFGLEMRGVAREDREPRALEMLNTYGLGGRERDYPGQLSLGMRQRVALIRAFICEPALLLLDEPFAALDAQTRLTLQQELLALWAPTSMSVVFVTHDVDEAILLSDRIMVMDPKGCGMRMEVPVRLPRPRYADEITSAEFSRTKRQILSALDVLQRSEAHA